MGRVGENYINNLLQNFIIIDYVNSRKVSIRFEDGTIVRNKNYSDIIRGEVKNPNSPSVCNIGYIGIGEYGCKNKKAYSVWVSMLKRCYNEKLQEKQPTYKGCSVVKEWCNFQNFAEWFGSNYTEGWQLDKDILVRGNKIYSPETCCFVPHEINSLFTRKQNKRGEHAIGTSFRSGKYHANINTKGATKYLGSFDTVYMAFEVYKSAKENEIKNTAEKWKNKIKTSVYKAMYEYKIEIND